MNRTKALECMVAEKSRDKNELGERVEVLITDFWDPPTLEAPIFSLDSLLQTSRSKTLKTFFSALVARNLALSTRLEVYSKVPWSCVQFRRLRQYCAFGCKARA